MCSICPEPSSITLTFAPSDPARKTITVSLCGRCSSWMSSDDEGLVRIVVQGLRRRGRHLAADAIERDVAPSEIERHAPAAQPPPSIRRNYGND